MRLLLEFLGPLLARVGAKGEPSNKSTVALARLPRQAWQRRLRREVEQPDGKPCGPPLRIALRHSGCSRMSCHQELVRRRAALHDWYVSPTRQVGARKAPQPPATISLALRCWAER